MSATTSAKKSKAPSTPAPAAKGAARLKPTKPYILEDFEVTYRKEDNFGRRIFGITEAQHDEITEGTEDMRNDNGAGPASYDDFDNEYVLRGRFYHKLTDIPELEEGENYLLDGRILNRAIPETDEKTGKRLKTKKNTVYLTIMDVRGSNGDLLDRVPKAAAEPEPEVVPEPAKKKAKTTKKSRPAVEVEDEE